MLGAARRLATAREVSLGRVISELARQGLQVAVKPATRRGFPVFGANDMLIAAHARAVGAVCVTADLAEFRRVPGLKVENWLARS